MSRVLIIEDDAILRSVLLRAASGAGHVVHGADDGRQGLRDLEAWPFEIVVTDILMPEMDGLEVIDSLRRRHPEVCIIAMTGGGWVNSIDYAELAERLGAHVTLRKPFSVDHLLHALEDVGARGSEPPGQKAHSAPGW